MGIDYALELPCPPREALTSGTLAGFVKQRRQVEAVRSRLPPGKSPSDVRVTRIVQGPSGSLSRSSTLRELSDETRALDAHAGSCTDCPANGLASPYGCIDDVPYPIVPSTEDWALSLLPEDPSSTAGTFLLAAIQEMNYSGQSAATLRSGEAGIFTRNESSIRTLGKDFAVTFDQLFEMFFMTEAIDPPHAIVLLLLTGFLPHDYQPRDVLRLQREDSFRATLLKNPPPAPRSPGDSTAPLFRYLVALRRAAALNSRVLVSY